MTMVIHPIVAGFDLALGGFDVVALAAIFAAYLFVWLTPAGIAGAVAGLRLARRPAVGFLVGWLAGTVAGGVVVIAAGSVGVDWGLSLWVLAPVALALAVWFAVRPRAAAGARALPDREAAVQ